MLSTLDAARCDKSLTENCCRVQFMMCWHKFQMIFNSRCSTHNNTHHYWLLLFPHLIHFIPCQCRIVLFTYWAIADHVGPYYVYILCICTLWNCTVDWGSNVISLFFTTMTINYLFIYRVQCRQTLAVAARRIWCRHGVTPLSRRNKATSASDCRPSAPWVLSSAGKLIRYLHGSHFLPYHSADVFWFCFLSAISFCHSARLFTERSLLHIMSRHAPYCWLATSLFWYSAPTLKRFLKHFWKIAYPTFNCSMLRHG